jgi:hypothetical protein
MKWDRMQAGCTSFFHLKKPSHVLAIGVAAFKFDFSIEDDDPYCIPGAESEPTQYQLVR